MLFYNVHTKLIYLGGEKMSIGSDLLRGNTEMIILSQLYKGDSYGYKINKAIKQRSGGKYELKEATLYSAFKRLESSGAITSYWGNEMSGARRRYYSLTPVGKAVYFQLKTEWENSKSIINSLIEEN